MNMLEAMKQKRDSLDQLVEDGVVNVSLLNDFDWLIEQAIKAENDAEQAAEYHGEFY